MRGLLPVAVAGGVLGLAWPAPVARTVSPAPIVARRWHVPRSAVVAVVVGMAALVDPVLGLAVGLATWAWLRHRRASMARAERAALVRCLPDVVDLLLLATEAGLSLPLAHPIVATRASTPLGPALTAAEERARTGVARADALVDALVPLGPGAAALAHVLADHLRYGTPLGAALEALRLEVRTERRHAIEEAARQVPVRLLGPLVLCVLPAFGALTVVPLLIASLDALPH